RALDGAGVGGLVASVYWGEETRLRGPGDVLLRSGFCARARAGVDFQTLRRRASEEHRHEPGDTGLLARESVRHDLSLRGRHGPQLRLADPEQLRRLRLAARGGRSG